MSDRTNKLLSITILTGTLNPNLKTFRLMLDAVKKQRYEGKIRMVVMDGGSTNGAMKLAKKYGCIIRVFQNDSDEGSNRLFPCKDLISGDIVFILASDNILPDKDFLTRMVKPFEDKKIFAAFPAYNTAAPDMGILTRYTALVGSPDPTLYYLGKSDKIQVFQKTYDKGEILKENVDYYKVRFTKETLPTVGENGFAIRTEVFKSMVRKNEVFYHTDKYAELLVKGFDTYGVTKNAIVHMTKPGIFEQIRRRVEVKEHFTDDMKGKRTYLVYNPASSKDRWHLFFYVLYSLTFIQPLVFSIRGYVYVHDLAWFLHPIMCFLMVCAYGWSEIKRTLRSMV